MKRAARLTSETKPAGIKAATWVLIEGAHARRRGLLASRGNAKKAQAIARYLWSVKDELSSEPRAAGPTPAKSARRVRFGNPLRNVPASFTRKTFA